MDKPESFEPALRLAAALVQPKRILEWGPGRSTELLAELCPAAAIVSIEHHPTWFQRQTERLRRYRHVELVHQAQGEKAGQNTGYATYPIRRWWFDHKFDLAFVDGRARTDCLTVARLVVGEWGIVALHDYSRPGYLAGIGLYACQHVVSGSNTILLAARTGVLP